MSARQKVSTWPKTWLNQGMFDPSDSPRVFAVPLGVDFPKALVDGLIARSEGQPPEALARVQLIVNTRRMARRVRALFDTGPARLLPRIGLISDLGETWSLANIPDPVSPLRRRLELLQLVSALLESQPDLAPRSSFYDLADSLAALMDEMHGEGVPPDRIDALDVTDQSGHWARIRAFLGIVRHYFDGTTAPDLETRQRLVIEALIRTWEDNPPRHPIILAGSTGSRGATQLLMTAIARLPQGAVIWPGYDTDMPADVWQTLGDPKTSEDHPQYRFAHLMQALDLAPTDILPWSSTDPSNPARNRVMSLALRPAPITDQWRRDGPDLRDIAGAMQDVTLLEAPSARIEALTIAMRLREAAETGQAAALITPDRTLSRQVTAALGRWSILPDDSAGVPLHLSAPGRFLRHVAELLHLPLSAELLLTLLKHPLTHTGSERGAHLRLTRELELHLRRHGPPYPDAADISAWAHGVKDPHAPAWADWLIGCFTGQQLLGETALADVVARHMDLAERISSGSDTTAPGGVWQHEDGREAHKTVSILAENADASGPIAPKDYATLFHAVLSREAIRQPADVHPLIRIWGTLEARVQGVDLLILAGMNEGSWPETPKPDPWLNRALRHQAGLLLPERRIGLSAHDFQQAVLAPEVWITRSVRSDDAETVPSRWLNRLTNLLDGLPAQNGPDTLEDMRRRGRVWLRRAELFEDPGQTDPAKRPSPRPPADARPRQLSVTQIQKLIRDPYAIYARHVLGLRPLDPLMKLPDALLRGTVLHEVLENFIQVTKDTPDRLTREALTQETVSVLAQNVPWAEARMMWQARMERIADRFVTAETNRRTIATPAALEVKGAATLDDLNFTLTAKADRIDIDDQGQLHLYDYKTGSVPTSTVQRHFDKQLLLEAAIAEQSGFGEIPASSVARAVFLSLGSGKPEEEAPLDTDPPEKVWNEFHRLMAAYLSSDLGFTARRAVQKAREPGDYDQLARFGEWDVTDPPDPQDVGQ